MSNDGGDLGFDPGSIKPNSHKYREEAAAARKEKKVEKVVKGKAKLKKKGLKEKFAETFIKSDAEDVKSYIIFDVIVPTVIDTFRDTINGAIDMFLYGDSHGSRGGSRTRTRGSGSYTSYQRYYDEPRRRDRREPESGRRGFKDFDLPGAETREDAIEARDSLMEILDMYGEITVAEYYRLFGVEGEYTGNYYGWTDRDIPGMPSLTRSGSWWYLLMPKARLLDP